MSGRSLLLTLLQRGDEVSIELGKVVVRAKSGIVVPKSWMKKHRHALAKAILCELGLDAFEYISFSTGFYGKKRHEGVTLQFVSFVRGDEAYAIFNAHVTRARKCGTAKKGSPLPNKGFRVSKRSHFYKFWLSTGLAVPKRLSAFRGYMGNLRDILFTASIVRNRMDAGSIRPLSVRAEEIRAAFLMTKPSTGNEQYVDKACTNAMNKDFHQTPVSSGLQPNTSTCVHNHGNKVISKRENTGMIIPFPQQKTPKDMTVDEWADELREALGLPPWNGS
jgi:hypothetical protein